MLSELQLSALLNSADRARNASTQPGGSLLPFLCQALLQHLGLADVQIWQVEFDRVDSLWKSRSAENEIAIAEVDLIQIEPGESRQLAASPDSNHGETGGLPICLSLTSAVVVESSRLVVGFLHTENKDVADDLLQIGEIIADIRRRELLQKLYVSYQNQNKTFAFLTQLHSATSDVELMHLFVTDAAVVSDFKRISIVSRQPQGGWGVTACTGVDAVSARSEEVQRIRADVKAAEQANLEDGTIFPLTPNGDWKSAKYAAVFEKEGETSPTDRQLGKFLADQLAMAMTYVRERKSSRRWKGSVGQSRGVGGVVALLLLVCLSVLCLWQSELKIRVFGQAVPQQRQEIFAPDRGIIRVVHVHHEEVVNQGDILFEIQNDELIVMREKTREDLVAAQARLAALQTLSQRPSANSPTSPGVLPVSVEQAELGKRIESLTTQVALIEEQISALKVLAPFSGQVFRERMQEELLGRPIQQGQYLMQIAAIDGPWELKLRIPETEVRHVLAQRSASEQELALTFALETSPDVERQSSIRELSTTTDMDAYGDLSTLAIGRMDITGIEDVRFGAGVLAKIHCGRRSWGYLVTRGLFDFWARYSPF